MKKTMRTITIALAVLLGLGVSAGAQVITPTGVTNGKASQLVFWFSEDELNTRFIVTNTSNDSPVTVHIQIWSNNGTGDITLIKDEPLIPDPCLEFNFTDEFTENDTHEYNPDFIIRNVDPPNGAFAEPPEAQGFITVTPVVSATDRRAIAFNNLIGRLQIFDWPDVSSAVNAMGREARSFIDSSLLPDGTILDGITGGYVLLRPEVQAFNFFTDGPGFALNTDASIVTITFADNYVGPFGDYRSMPASARLDTLLFNEFEVPTSCQTLMPTCVLDIAVNEETFPENDDNLDTDLGRYCPGNTVETGWVRIAVTELGSLTSHIGLTFFDVELNDASDHGGMGWMVVQGDSVFPAPAPSPSPSVAPSPTPSGGAASPSPTGGGQPGGGGGGSGCAIAGPVQAGTAAANMLIVLLPGAVFALRRRFAK